jgi:hypothetical protein
MTDEERILARLDALEAEIAALRRDLHARGAARATSMAEDGRCPACGSKRLLHAHEIPDAEAGRGKLSLSRASVFSSRRAGQLEAWVCTRCRLVEWRVESLDDVDADGQQIELVDAEDAAPGSPYR